MLTARISPASVVGLKVGSSPLWGSMFSFLTFLTSPHGFQDPTQSSRNPLLPPTSPHASNWPHPPEHTLVSVAGVSSCSLPYVKALLSFEDSAQRSPPPGRLPQLLQAVNSFLLQASPSLRALFLNSSSYAITVFFYTISGRNRVIMPQ